MDKISSIDWLNIPSGTMLHMKDFPSVKLLKLDNSKGCYFNYESDSLEVEVKEYVSETHGNYYYFQTHKDDWHPLTTRLWTNKND